MKTLLTLALLTLTSTALASPSSYSYKVYVLPPFGKVLINDSIICPHPTTNQNPCQIDNQQPNTLIKITGTKDHLCLYKVNPDGTLEKDNASSDFCAGGYTIPATKTTPGQIHLPKHF